MTHTPLAHSVSAKLHPLLARAHDVAALALTNAGSLDCAGAFPSDEIAALHRFGLLHAPFSVACGGCDLGSAPSDPALLFDVLATIAGGSLALGRLYEGHVNAVKLVRLYGSAANIALLRAEADAGRLTGVWMAEDATSLRLENEADERRLVGRKILASGAGHIQRPLVAARVDGDNQLMLPHVDDMSRVDVSGWTATGMKATATGTVDFTGIAITADEIVGQPGDYIRPPYFRGGAWRVMAVQFGGVQALLESYRRQIIEAGRDVDRVQRVRFAEAVAAVETARLWILEACRRAEDENGDPATIDAYVDLMRGAFERAALIVVERAEKSLGLKAFMHPNPVERIARDLTTYLRQPSLDASLESAGAFFFHQAIGSP